MNFEFSTELCAEKMAAAGLNLGRELKYPPKLKKASRESL
jgi:hypothetical protein